MFLESMQTQTKINHSKISQDLFNRLGVDEKIKILEYVSSPKHVIILDCELK